MSGAAIREISIGRDASRGCVPSTRPLNTCVDDGRITRNPSRIKGAGEHRAAERPTATVRPVYDLADRMPARFRALVLPAAFTGLRWGELVGLRRCDADLTTGTLYVRRRLAQLSRDGMQPGPPKSVAGVRNVALPPFLVDELRGHITEHARRGPDGLIFRGEKSAMLRQGSFGRATSWTETVVKADLPPASSHPRGDENPENEDGALGASSHAHRTKRVGAAGRDGGGGRGAIE